MSQRRAKQIRAFIRFQNQEEMVVPFYFNGHPEQPSARDWRRAEAVVARRTRTYQAPPPQNMERALAKAFGMKVES